MDKIYKVSEVSNILGINRNQVYELIKCGSLRAFKIKTLRVTEGDLNAFISSRKDVFSETLGKENDNEGNI